MDELSRPANTNLNLPPDGTYMPGRNLATLAR